MSDSAQRPFAIVTGDELSVRTVQDAVGSPRSGAVVVFHGVVRNHDDGNDILSLDYRAHPDAERLLGECCASIAEETGLAVAAAHRVGHLEIGDTALVAAVSAAHRREAFDACELLVERIKSTVPIWKRQYFTTGESEWVGL